MFCNGRNEHHKSGKNIFICFFSINANINKSENNILSILIFNLNSRI